MKKLNNKGLITGIEWMFVIAVPTLMVLWSVGLTDSHRERKYVEQCMNTGASKAHCMTEVSSKSESEILAYIKDDDMTTGNHGNGPGGIF